MIISLNYTTADKNEKDYLTCQSLVPMFKDFPQRKRRWVKIKITTII